MIGRRALLASAAVLGGIARGGCTTGRPKPVDFSEVSRSYRPGDYERVRREWTRHVNVVRDFGMVIEVWATYKSWDFRQAYIEQYGDVYGLSAAQRTELRGTQLEAAQSVYEFHVAAQSTDYRWNNIEDQESSWRVSLVDGTGAELRPESIQPRALPAEMEMQFFPEKTDFTRSYLVTFLRAVKNAGATPAPKFLGSASGSIMLRIAGPLGRADLLWEGRGG